MADDKELGALDDRLHFKFPFASRKRRKASSSSYGSGKRLSALSTQFMATGICFSAFRCQVPQPLTLPSPYRFHEPDLLWHLISIYFTETAPYLSLIHAPPFKRAVINGLHPVDHNFGAVVLAVCLMLAALKFLVQNDTSRKLFHSDEDVFGACSCVSTTIKFKYQLKNKIRHITLDDYA